MVRNGWYMPSPKESICTLKFMMKVRKGKIWCPKQSEMRPRQIPEPPPRQELADAIHESIQEWIRNNKIDDEQKPKVAAFAKNVKKKLADSDWLQAMLFYCDPDHRFFSKGYGY